MLDKIRQVGERLLFFQDQISIMAKYDLWRAMDFEQVIQVVSTEGEE
jgi:hypothetical protein